MKTFIKAFRIFLFFTVLTGILYPLLVTGIAQMAFPHYANGSLIVMNNKLVGSELIGQQFDSTVYFSPRPSAISYNPLPSGGSNFGLTNQKLKNLVHERKLKFNEFNEFDSLKLVPSEMLFASASGLDPHISVGSAVLQVERVARSRNFNSTEQMALLNTIYKLKESPQFGFLGNERINVLLLNIELDKLVNYKSGVRH